MASFYLKMCFQETAYYKIKIKTFKEKMNR